MVIMIIHDLKKKNSPRMFPVSCRPCGTSLRTDHLFPALFFFDKGGKPVVNLPMKWAFSAEVSTRTSYSCAARHGDLQQSPVGGTDEHPG